MDSTTPNLEFLNAVIKEFASPASSTVALSSLENPVEEYLVRVAWLEATLPLSPLIEDYYLKQMNGKILQRSIGKLGV